MTVPARENPAAGAVPRWDDHRVRRSHEVPLVARRPEVDAFRRALERAGQGDPGVLLLDAPLIAGWRAHGLRMAKLTGEAPRLLDGTPMEEVHTQRLGAEPATLLDHGLDEGGLGIAIVGDLVRHQPETGVGREHAIR